MEGELSEVPCVSARGAVGGHLPRCKDTVTDVAEYRKLSLKKGTVVSQTARRPSQSILEEINPEYSSEGLMLKLQYFGHLM